MPVPDHRDLRANGQAAGLRSRLRQIRTSHKQDVTGSYRWHDKLPEGYWGQDCQGPFYINEEDATGKFNETENVRPIPPSNPDFKWITVGGQAQSPSSGGKKTRCTSAGHTASGTPASM